MKKTVLLLKGGGSSEHDISLISSDFIESKIDTNKFDVICVEIDKDFQWKKSGLDCELNFKRELIINDSKTKIDVAIPCFHGFPGETGSIQSFFELIKLPYLGCNSETSLLCFNKLATKLFLESLGVKTTPFIQIQNADELQDAKSFLNKYGHCYLKATNQGSSVGCYHVKSLAELEENINPAFSYSPFVILEQAIDGRELEVSAFEFQGKNIITAPGEIICETDFYDFEQKYSKDSTTKTIPQAQDISQSSLNEINRQASLAFKALKMKDLSRIDFFLSDNNEVFINEINTFPGHTSISMFPMMVEASGIKYSDFINDRLEKLTE